MSIYVEILIRAPIDELWARTQTPSLHERWDLRFTKIDYIPKAFETDPQQFRYTTRIGFGLEVHGEGETVWQRDSTDGSRSSALKFGSGEARSIIREGSGYWRYVPAAGGIRFLTWYDYRTRFGSAGALFDRFVFRPLLGWATAWSFDRLRLWLERGIDPALALRQTLVHAVARLAMSGIFFYQGIAPKLLGRHQDEIAMLRDAGVPEYGADAMLVALGAFETLFAIALVAAWSRQWPAWVAIGAMAAAATVVGSYSPRFIDAAFNPITLNLAVAALAAVDLLVIGNVPSAARCRRRPCTEQP